MTISTHALADKIEKHVETLANTQMYLALTTWDTISNDFLAAVAALRAPNQPVEAVADSIIAQIEERFPNWKSYRDLVDCIDCTLHTLRGGR